MAAKKISRIAARKKAINLGAAFKPGFPATYTKTQTKPVYYKPGINQRKEFGRLYFSSMAKGEPITWSLAYGILRKKYKRKNLKFYPFPRD